MARYLEIVKCFNAEKVPGVRQRFAAFCQLPTAYRLLLTAYCSLLTR